MSRQPIFVQYARYLGAFPQKRTRTYVVLGQDGGQSVALDDGVLFFFSDTLMLSSNERASREHPAPSSVPSHIQSFFLANCAAVAGQTDLPSALDDLQYFEDEEGLPREILPPTERERFRRLRFWPEHGALVNGKVYFYYLGVQTTDAESIWGFRNLGAGLAVLDPKTCACERLQYRGDWLFWRNSHVDTHFGVQVVQEREYLYVFGSVRSGIQSQALLARVPADRLTEYEAYEYLSSATGVSGPVWAANFEHAAPLGPTASQYSVSYNPYLGSYVMWFVDEYQKRLKLRTANHIWGPYSDPVDLIGVPHSDRSLLTYLGFEHPQFQQEAGRKVFVSYCEPHFESSSLIAVTLGRR